MLDHNRHEPITGERREHFEHAFMPQQPELASFYDNHESEIYRVATNHYHTRHDALSMFISCASSLHLVLCYAKSFEVLGHEAYVSVMDRKDLDFEIYVWHVPHIIKGSNHEFLAYGVVRGRAYKSVRLRDIERNGLIHVSPEVNDPGDRFGRGRRRLLFREQPVDVQEHDFICTANIAFLFDNMAVPVASALMCMRPRQGLAPAVTRKESDNEADRYKGRFALLVQHLALRGISFYLESESWMTPSKVDVASFPDVFQWIRLLRMLTMNSTFQPVAPSPTPPPPPPPPSQGEKPKRDSADDWPSRLRPRKKARED